MNIGLLAFAFAIVAAIICAISAPSDPARQRIDCRPVNAVKTVDTPAEI